MNGKPTLELMLGSECYPSHGDVISSNLLFERRNLRLQSCHSTLKVQVMLRVTDLPGPRVGEAWVHEGNSREWKCWSRGLGRLDDFYISFQSVNRTVQLGSYGPAF